MNNGLLAAALMLSAGLPVPLESFCVRPGDSIEAVHKQCRVVSEGVDYTEEGTLPHLKVAYGRDVVSLDIYDGKIDLIQFRRGLLPFPGVALGDDLGSIKRSNPSLELRSMQGEEGYLVSLKDSRRCMSLIFEAGHISDADFKQEKFDDLKLVGINWVVC